MCSARHVEDKEGSDKLSWEQTLISVWASIQIRVSCTSKQTRIAHYAQQSTLTDRLHQACGTNREKTTKTPRRVSNQKEQPRQRGQIDKLDYTSICACHPNITVTRLSHNSIGHGVVGVNMVVKGCSSQQKKEKKKSDFCYEKCILKNKWSKEIRATFFLENNQRVKARNVKTAIFWTWELSVQKKQKKREMQRISRGRDQWQQNAHGPNSLNYVTTRSNGQERVFNRARNPQRMWISRDYHKMRHGQKHCVTKANFVEKDVIQNNKKRWKGIFKEDPKNNFFKGMSKKSKND